MTWNCPTCEHANIWWKNLCEVCGAPQRGFDPKPGTQPPDPKLELALDFARQIPVQRHYLTGLPDCGCPAYGSCLNAACPRRIVTVTC